jgi:hypothetical protein
MLLWSSSKLTCLDGTIVQRCVGVYNKVRVPHVVDALDQLTVLDGSSLHEDGFRSSKYTTYNKVRRRSCVVRALNSRCHSNASLTELSWMGMVVVLTRRFGGVSLSAMVELGAGGVWVSGGWARRRLKAREAGLWRLLC